MNQDHLKILKGCLTDPESGLRIGFEEGCWVLACSEGDSYDILCRQENWNDFIDSVYPYSNWTEFDE